MFGVNLEQLRPLGHSLQRPECVLATARGTLFVSNWLGGISRIDATGAVHEVLAPGVGFLVQPNGIAYLKDGSFLLCHLGANDGGVYQLRPSGKLEPFLLEVEGKALPPTNFIHLDSQERLWITVSTVTRPRALAYRSDISDGFIVLLENGSARVVADNLGYTNECLVHPDGKRLFVNETFARRLSCFDIASNGSLSNKQTIAEFGAGTFPDGMAFDAEGGTWITSIVSNRLIRVAPSGEQTLVFEDADPEHLQVVETAFQSGNLGREHLDTIRSQRLKSISSLAFSGPDLKTIVLGCLLGQELFSFRSPIAGIAPTHWQY